MRRNARRGDARWMDEVVCVECEDRDDEPRERFGRRRPGKRLALMEGKPRPPVGTKAFAKSCTAGVIIREKIKKSYRRRAYCSGT